MDRKENRRKWSGLLVRRNEQLKWAVSITGASVLITTTLIIIVGVSFKAMIDRWKEMGDVDPELAAVLQNSLMPGVTEMIGALILVSILLVIFLIKSSHSYYGPLVPIQRHIESLIKGEYSSRINLRKGDELTEVAGSLNKLAETLQSGKR